MNKTTKTHWIIAKIRNRIEQVRGVEIGHPVLSRDYHIVLPADLDKRRHLILLNFLPLSGILPFMARVLCFLSSSLTATVRSRQSPNLEIGALRRQLSSVG